jgi:hypothetical protein
MQNSVTLDKAIIKLGIRSFNKGEKNESGARTAPAQQINNPSLITKYEALKQKETKSNYDSWKSLLGTASLASSLALLTISVFSVSALIPALALAGINLGVAVLKTYKWSVAQHPPATALANELAKKRLIAVAA